MDRKSRGGKRSKLVACPLSAGSECIIKKSSESIYLIIYSVTILLSVFASLLKLRSGIYKINFNKIH